MSDAAAILGVTRQALSLLLNERTNLSSEMALRIEEAFGPKMDHLMRMQLVFDLTKQREGENTEGEALRAHVERPVVKLHWPTHPAVTAVKQK